MKCRIFLIVLSIFVFCTCTVKTHKQRVSPTKDQIEWADAEIGVLIHFDMPVFSPDYDWRRDMGKHPEASMFNPTELNTDQWIEAAKAAGANYAILVAKHCSGFSLWPTKTHEYSVKNSPWKNGQGDLVKDFISSCLKYGVKPGIYASTAANGYLHVDNPGKVLSGDPEEQKRYVEVVKTQLTELWSNYGDLFEIWFDGGVLPPEKGGFDVLSLLKQYQPNAIAFQGPFGFENNIRWVGNEEGVAPDPCWATADSTSSASGIVEIKGLNGNPDGKFWCPGEADFPLRWNSSFQGGWFWKQGEDDKMFNVDQLVEKYNKSVGRNANMLIGVVVDNRGLVPDADVKRLEDLGNALTDRFSPDKMIGETSGRGLEFNIKMAGSQKVNCIVLCEDIRYGERIRKYKLERYRNGIWEKIGGGESIGHKRIFAIPDLQMTKVRLKVLKSARIPHIKSFAAFRK